jgi:hypothetical protein
MGKTNEERQNIKKNDDVFADIIGAAFSRCLQVIISAQNQKGK